MNKIYKLTLLLGVSLGLSLSSCNKFLDVQPTGTLIEDKQFEDVQGFYDALYGVYGKMASKSMYGEELSYGFLDKIGQQFCYKNTESLDPQILKYEYTNNRIRPIIDHIWENQYQTISYINNILKQLDKTELNHSNLPWVRGEALALRAFLHFDVIRLFTDKYEGNENERGIPYAYKFDLKNKKLFTLKESYENVIKDLKEAEQLLAKDKEVKGEVEVSSDFRAGRVAHINLYAIKALLARVYYTMGNSTEASKYAEEVIQAKENFHLVKSTEIEQIRRFPASPELIFGLHNVNLSSTVAELFLTDTKSSGTFTEARKDLPLLYETKTFSATNTDVRYTTFYEEVKRRTYGFIRLIKSENEVKSSLNKLQGICLIRLPEMYYILSESLFDTNKDKAISLLDEVRASRGLAPIDKQKVGTKELFQKEMSNERMREFPGEGQIFYGLKHYNQEFIGWDKKKIKPSKEIFVLPWPERELEYGNK